MAEMLFNKGHQQLSKDATRSEATKTLAQ